MTIDHLRRYRKIRATIRSLEAELDELILKSQPFDSVGRSPYSISDNVARIVMERDETRRRINSLQAEKNAVEVYITNCDPYYSTLLRWHYIEGRTWASISIRLGGGNTDEGIKKACHRYIHKNP